MPSEQDHFDASRKFQAYYDEVLRKIGVRAPQPVLGTTVNDYRRETLRNLKRTFLPQNHDLYQVQFRQLQPMSSGYSSRSFSMLALLKLTILRTSHPESLGRSKNTISTAKSKPSGL